MLTQTPAEIEVSADLVRQLLREQHPDLSELAIVRGGIGWANHIFKVGEILCVRVPRRAATAPLLRKEQEWLLRVQARVDMPLPVPLRLGIPSNSFPYPWSVVPWVDGMAVEGRPLRAGQHQLLAAFLRQLHAKPPTRGPENQFRSGPLRNRHADFQTRLCVLQARGISVEPSLVNTWLRGVDAPEAQETVWIHGDLHPLNVIARDGRIASVIDWGNLAQGDPATDIATAWMTLSDSTTRRRMLWQYGVSGQQLSRALAWAVFFGVSLLELGTRGGAGFDSARTVGKATLERVLVDTAHPFPALW